MEEEFSIRTVCCQTFCSLDKRLNKYAEKGYSILNKSFGRTKYIKYINSVYESKQE